MVYVRKGVEAQIFRNEKDTKVIMLSAVNTFNYYHCCRCRCCYCSTHCQPLYVKGNSSSTFYASIKAMSLSNVRRMFVAFNYQLKTERSYHKILKLHPFVSPSLALHRPLRDARYAAAAYFGCLAVPYCALPHPTTAYCLFSHIYWIVLITNWKIN